MGLLAIRWACGLWCGCGMCVSLSSQLEVVTWNFWQMCMCLCAVAARVTLQEEDSVETWNRDGNR